MGQLHIKKDTEINWEQAAEVQKKQNGHVLAWLKMTDAGSAQNHEERFRMTCTSEAVSPAVMYLLHKDHKPTSPSETPKSCPVVNDKSGMGVHLSNIVSSYLEPIA